MHQQHDDESIIILEDEDGAEVEFEMMDIVPYGGSEYAVLLPAEDDSDEVEAVILEVLPSADGTEEDMLQGIEDEAVLDAVFALFLERSKAEDGEN